MAAAKLMTFEQAADAFYKGQEASWKNARHRQQWTQSMRDYVLPRIGALAVADIDVGQVLRCIEPAWQTKAVTMMRVRSRIESVLAWATVRGYRHGDNPAKWTGNLKAALPSPSKVAKVEHHAALPYAELPTFMSELAALPGIPARALEFLILTASRTGEVVDAKWTEIDLDKATWIIPKTRMKAGREHRVPLSPRAVELLAALPREGDWVFPSPVRARANISDAALLQTVRRLRTGITPHGFRSTFSDWAHETTNFPNHAIELSLAHTVGSDTEQAYRRGPMIAKRTKLMEQWAAYCYASPAEVVPLRKTAQ
ncbi:MAG: site-specific integrase [Rhodoplanes sp.]